MSDGFYMTPNLMIPLNKRETGEIADVALDQLRPYQEAADQWPMHRAYHPVYIQVNGEPVIAHGKTRYGMECRLCGQFIYYISDPNGNAYSYQDGETKTLTVAHIRRQHEEKVVINDQGHCEILDLPADNDFGGGYSIGSY
jgi:hypothetical protein